VFRQQIDDGDAASEPQVRMFVDGRELDAEEMARYEANAPGRFLVELQRDPASHAPMLWLSGDRVRRAIPLPSARVDAALERFGSQLGTGLLFLLGAGLLLSLWLAQRIAQPLRALSGAARRVGEGRLGEQVPAGGPPEVRDTIAAFNAMSARLARLDAETEALRADRELAELGEIGRGLAHSLRNPLHALGLSLEALAAQAADPARAQALAQSGREQLQRVDQALRGFLALSADATSQRESVVLKRVIDDVLLEASQRAAGRVRFARSGEELSLVAVEAEVRVMLHALVVNALEASPDGGEVRIEVEAREAGAVELRVLDEGPGVPDALRARLFQPHVSGKPHGAGMGLYLAERLARLRYRGGIELTSRAPCGTCATLRLQPRGGAHD
jgi:signal transduction histidine kinase